MACSRLIPIHTPSWFTSQQQYTDLTTQGHPYPALTPPPSLSCEQEAETPGHAGLPIPDPTPGEHTQCALGLLSPVGLFFFFLN